MRRQIIALGVLVCAISGQLPAAAHFAKLPSSKIQVPASRLLTLYRLHLVQKHEQEINKLFPLTKKIIGSGAHYQERIDQAVFSKLIKEGRTEFGQDSPFVAETARHFAAVLKEDLSHMPEVHPASFVATAPELPSGGNRNLLQKLVSTNILGQNTPAISQAEFEYQEMWAKDVSAMVGYH